MTGLSSGQTYSYRVKSKDAAGNQAVSSNFTFATAADTTAPGDVQHFTAVPGNGQVTLSWTNPADSDFKGVMIRCRADGGFPANKGDGVLVADVAGAGGANASFLHSGLTNGTTYYYSAFTYDTAENYSSTAHAQATPANVSITSLTPKQGNAGTAVVISGSGFGNLQATSTVSFNGVSAAVSAWSDTSISTSVPTQAATGPVIVTVNGVTSNQVIFRVGEKLEAPERFRRK